MTPEQTAAAEVVTAELQAYSDQLAPGAPEQLGRTWVELGKMTPEHRAEAIAQRMASPVVDRFRDPRYDPTSADAPTALDRAIAQQGHRLKDGAAAELASKLAVELAGRNPAKLAGEVARRLDQADGHRYLKDAPAAPAHVARLNDLIWDNFKDVVDPSKLNDLVRDRGADLRNLSDSQVIRAVAGALRAGVNRDRYGNGAEIPAGDVRFLGGPPRQITAARATSTTPTTPTRESSGRFASTPETPPRRRMSF